MATTFKPFVPSSDITTTKTLLHEAIPITGTIISGTYNAPIQNGERNIRNYSHGMFQSVYDYPYLSSSANHIFDITLGYSAKSAMSGTSAVVQQEKKINIYEQMAQVLMGHDKTGSIHEFDQDGDISAGGTKIREAFFVSFARLLVKDEIKKDSFRLTLLTGGATEAAEGALVVGDYNSSNNFRVNSPAGEYGILYTGTAAPNPNSGVGLLYYQAGVAVITASVFPQAHKQGAVWTSTLNNDAGPAATFGPSTDIETSTAIQRGSVDVMMTGSEISSSADGLRNRIQNVRFNNTVELNSTVYFCRANYNEFNYSANPTYLTGSKIRVKESSTDAPITYMTTVGLYSADNELMAVAKLSEPLKKDPSNELTLRVRLDY